MTEVQKTDPGLVVRSVNSLQWFYTIVLSLAITEAIKALIGIDSNPGSIRIHDDYLPTFLALIVTLIPFHQGMNTYLDMTYIHQKTTLNAFVGLIDFVFFFTEAMVFYVMALSIKDPMSFFMWIMILLILDVIWLIFVYFANAEIFKAISAWFAINILAAFVLCILLYTPLLNNDIHKWMILSALLFVRTVIDYAKTWPFYWPYVGKNSG